MLHGKWLRGLAEGWECRNLLGIDRARTISAAMVQRAQQKGLEARRTVLLPNWVDLEAIQPQGHGERAANPYRRELGVPAGAVVLQFSGSMNKRQGLQLLVAVIKQLADVQNLLWLLAVEGPTKEALIEATAGLDQGRGLPLQMVEQLNNCINLADVHLIPQKAGPRIW